MAEETSNNTKVTIDKQEEDKNKDKEITNNNPQEEKKDTSTQATQSAQQATQLGEGAGWNDITTNIMQSIGLSDLQSIIGDSEAIKARQHLLDPTKYEREIKNSNPGKMPNNEDAYPIDLKIEELEFHKPNIKLYKETTHIHGKDAMIAAMKVSDKAEKRIVKLENMVATLFRWFGRLGSRVVVNCQYYGGTQPGQKYKSIRCLADDRINDGQEIQIDQCLYCTRFEPIAGQMYEIMNDLGANVATILDDNQAGYTNMEEYDTLARVEKYWTAKEDAKFDLALVEKENTAETVKFKDIWGEGLKMNWSLTPKEDQIPHINWRQSISDDGSNLMRLASFTGNEVNAGKNLIKDGIVSDIMKKNKDAMDSYNENTDVNFQASKIKSIINEAKEYAKNLQDDVLNKFRRGLQSEVKEIVGDNDKADSLFIACASFVMNKPAKEVYEKYNDYLSKISTSNPSIGITAFTSGYELFPGSKEKKINRIDRAGQPYVDPDKKPTGTVTGNGNEDTNQKKLPIIKWEDRDGWLWVAYAGHHLTQIPLGDGSMDGKEKFPAICYLYCELESKARFSRYDETNYSFPFTDKELNNPGVTMGDSYGQTANGKLHTGTQFLVRTGTPFYSVADGKITGCGNDGEYGKEYKSINVQHNDGTFARYMCSSKMTVKRGDTVLRGQQLGLTGTDTTTNTECLYFELGQGDSEKAVCPNNPMQFFPKINYKKGEQILATGAKPKDGTTTVVSSNKK